jgi:hypothetical protein
MKVYQTDFDGFYIGETTAQESPLEPGVFLIPGGAYKAKPPSLSNGETAQIVDGAWVVIPAPPAPEVVPEPTAAELLAAERAAKSMSKVQFLNEVATRGILTDADAIAAAKGEWPTAMASFLDLLTAPQKRDVQIAWSASSQVDRMDTFLLTFASWLLPAAETETTMDAIFGIGA